MIKSKKKKKTRFTACKHNVQDFKKIVFFLFVIFTSIFQCLFSLTLKVNCNKLINDLLQTLFAPKTKKNKINKTKKKYL